MTSYLLYNIHLTCVPVERRACVPPSPNITLYPGAGPAACALYPSTGPACLCLNC